MATMNQAKAQAVREEGLLAAVETCDLAVAEAWEHDDRDAVLAALDACEAATAAIDKAYDDTREAARDEYSKLVAQEEEGNGTQ